MSACDLYIGSPFQLDRALAVSTFALNQTTDYIAGIVFIPPGAATRTIDRVFARASTVGTSGNHTAEFFSIAGDGSLNASEGASDATSVTVAGIITFSFSTPVNLAPGAHFIKIFNSAGNVTWRHILTNTSGQHFPYSGTVDAGGAFTRVTGQPMFACGDGTNIYGTVFDNLTTLSCTNASPGGMGFSLPAGWGNTFQLSGASILAGGTPTAGGTIQVDITEVGGTVRQTGTWDTDWLSSTADRPIYIPFTDTSARYDFSFGTSYQVRVTPSAGITLTLQEILVGSAGQFDGYGYEGGQSFWEISTTSWTTSAIRRPFINLHMTDWSEPAASGGGGGPLIGPGRLIRN